MPASIGLEIAEPFAASVEAARLERAARLALALHGGPQETGLAIVVTGDEPLQELNRRYRGVDSPTDVLAFPAGFTDPDSGHSYLGDLLISYPRAEAQAAAAGHPVVEELQLLVVHGVLHLLGYDHAAEAEKARMWAAQAEALKRLGISIEPPP